jgi:predicted TIM-barrel fold metal-dependent hydrolase
VLSGTEFPFQHPLAELAKYQALGLPAAQWQLVAWENANRLVRLTSGAPPLLL